MLEIFISVIKGLRLIFIWPTPLALIGGVVIGLLVGILPGIGGIGTLALMLPFVYKMSPPLAIAFLLGMHAVCNTSGGLTSVLFAIPGESANAATMLDGFPMAKKGQAAKACSIVLTASMVGGIVGALVLAISIPVMRAVIKAFGPPEFLMMVTMGISFVGVLSGGKPFLGIACGGLGILISLIGDDPVTGTIRYTFGWIYLWDGLQLVPLTVGLFAIGELLEYGIERTSISHERESRFKMRWDQVWEGISFVFRRIELTIRCALIGMFIGAVPGIGGVVASFVSYGHAKQTSRLPEEFGHGNPEGVLAPEAANNAKEGGALIPTIGFGIPGSAAMAIILAAFMILGIKPGPEMLSAQGLPTTFAIVWTVALANVLGAFIALSWVPLMARVTNLRPGILVPLVFVLAILGVSSRGYPEDILMALLFGVVGYVMRMMDLPRAPVILGFVLGRLFEINLHLTLQIYGPSFLLKRPIAFVIMLIIVFTIFWEIRSRLKERRTEGEA